MELRIPGTARLGLAFLLAHAWPASAEISFTGGYWESSLATCAEQVAPSGPFCGGWEVDDVGYVCTAGGTFQSQVSAAANFPGGGGGQGFRMYLGDTHNAMSTGTALRFATPQPELWVRYATRYAQGQTWGSILEHKMIYAFTDTGVAMNVNFPQGTHDVALQPRNTMGNPDLYVPGWGWNDLHPGGAADGSWHVYQHHFRLGQVGANDGVYQFWVDGVNRVDRRDLDFFNGGAANSTGFRQLVLPHNHNVSTAPGCTPVDVDDLAVAVPSYAAFVQDAQGRALIGGLSRPDGGTPGPDAGRPDAGGALDGGPADAGAQPDAGRPDAGGALDGGPSDAGAQPDAGVAPDGGAPASDAGPSGADAGVQDQCRDAGCCACATTPSGALFLALALALAGLARRRRA